MRFLSAVIAAMVLSTAGSAARAAEPIKLKLTLQLPITSHLGVNLAQFRDEVEKATNKDIQVEIIDNSRAFKDNEVIDAISSNKIEMGTVALTQFAQKTPATQLFEQPFLFNSEPLTRAATKPGSEIRTLIDSEILRTTGIRVLWWQSYGYSVFYTRGRPVDEIAGIRQMKVRTPGDIMRDFVEACGGVPTVISATQQNEALKTGAVDAAMTSIEGVEPRGLWQVTDTVTRTEHAAFEFVVMINESVWQKLNDQHRAILAQAALKVEKDLRDNMPAIEARSYEFAKSKNMKIISLTPNQLAEWRGCSAKVFENFMASNPEIALRMMTAYAKLRTDPCCNYQPDGDFRRH